MQDENFPNRPVSRLYMDPDAPLRREFKSASFHDLDYQVRVEREFVQPEWSDSDEDYESDSDLEVLDVVELSGTQGQRTKPPAKRVYRELPSDIDELSLQEQMMVRMVSKMAPKDRTYTVVETLFQGYDPDQVLEALEDLIE